MIKRAPFVAVLLTLSSVPAFAAGGMQPGLWEVTTRMQMAGMPMPPQTVRHCYTRQDVEKGDRTVPQADLEHCLHRQKRHDRHGHHDDERDLIYRQVKLQDARQRGNHGDDQ
jgi:hypothetical protein